MKRRLLHESDEEDAPRSSRRTQGSGHNMAGNDPKKAVASIYPSQSPLLQVLEKCGFTASLNANKSHTGDAASIRVALEKELRHTDASRMRGDLQALISQLPFLQSSLMPLITDGAREGHHMHLGARDESLVRLLLNVAPLQLCTMEALLEQLPLLQHHAAPNAEEPLALLRLALAQFRWLDIALVDAARLATKLVELLHGAPDATLQREVITLIPDVIDESTQATYVETLTALAAMDSTLRLPVIDTLGNLNLASKFQDDVRRLATETLRAARDEEIPVIIRFVMRSADSVEQLRPLMRELRLHVSPAHNSSSPQGLVLEAMKSGFQNNKHSVTAYVKELSASAAGEVRPVDVWFLIALLALAHHRKAAEKAIKNLACAQLLTPLILRNAIAGHAQALQPYFSVMLNLFDRFLRSSESAERGLGVELAVLCFRQFVSAGKQVGYHQQEVIGNLVSHIGSSARSEVDASLTALSRLCTEDAATVISYASTLKGILEYLSALSDSDVCRTFEMLSRLSVSKDKRSAEISDALEMLTHKHLGAPTLRDRRVGILGAVAMLRLPTGSSAQLQQRASSLLSQLLVPARRARSMPLALEFAYDELVTIGKEKGPLSEQIKAAVASPFQEAFLVFPSEDSNANGEGARWWDELESLEAVLNVMPLLQSTERRTELTWLAAQFKLMMSCCSDAEMVDNWAALVGCPVQMFPRDTLDPSEFAKLTAAAQADACSALYYAHGWFRELLNAFTPVAHSYPDIRRFLINRITLLPELESRIMRLAALCHWRPPSGEEATTKGAGGATTGKARGRPRKAGRYGNPSYRTQIRDDSTEEDKEGMAGASMEIYFRTLEPCVAPLLVIAAPDQVADDESSLNTQKPSRKKQESQPTLNTASLRAILSALIAPLAPYTQKKNISMHELDRNRRLQTPLVVIKQCVCPTLAALRSHCTHLLAELHSESDKKSEEEKIAILSVLGLAFSLLERSIHLSTPDIALQRQVLAAWTGTADADKIAQAELESAVLADFAEWAKRVKHLGTAVAVLNAALALDPLTPSSTYAATVVIGGRRADVRQSLSKLADAILMDEELGAQAKPKPEYLRLLFTVWVRYNKDPLVLLRHFAMQVLPSCAANAAEPEKGSEEKGIPFLTTATFPVFYRGALQELALAASALTPLLEADEAGETLQALYTACITFQLLIELLKAHHDARGVQTSALRYGKAVVDVALRWFPMLSRMLASHAAAIQPVIKALQQGARPLQAICADGKAKKDASLITLVPPSRKSLETLVFKIKGMFAANSFDPSAYRVANLKHKSVSGAEVSSQAPAEEEHSEAEEVEAIEKPGRKRKTTKKSKKDEAEAEEEDGNKKRKEKGDDEEDEDKEEGEEKGKSIAIAIDSDSEAKEKEDGSDVEDKDEGSDDEDEPLPGSHKKEAQHKRKIVVSDGE